MYNWGALVHTWCNSNLIKCIVLIFTKCILSSCLTLFTQAESSKYKLELDQLKKTEMPSMECEVEVEAKAPISTGGSAAASMKQRLQGTPQRERGAPSAKLTVNIASEEVVAINISLDGTWVFEPHNSDGTIEDWGAETIISGGDGQFFVAGVQIGSYKFEGISSLDSHVHDGTKGFQGIVTGGRNENRCDAVSGKLIDNGTRLHLHTDSHAEAVHGFFTRKQTQQLSRAPSPGYQKGAGFRGRLSAGTNKQALGNGSFESVRKKAANDSPSRQRPPTPPRSPPLNAAAPGGVSMSPGQRPPSPHDKGAAFRGRLQGGLKNATANIYSETVGFEQVLQKAADESPQRQRPAAAEVDVEASLGAEVEVELGRIEATFGKLDTNYDGKLSPEELVHSGVDARKLDADNDGVVSWEEFLASSSPAVVQAPAVAAVVEMKVDPAPVVVESSVSLEAVALKCGITVFTSSLGDKFQSTTERIERICGAIGVQVLMIDFVERPEVRQAVPSGAQLPLVMVDGVLLVGGFDEVARPKL